MGEVIQVEAPVGIVEYKVKKINSGQTQWQVEAPVGIVEYKVKKITLER